MPHPEPRREEHPLVPNDSPEVTGDYPTMDTGSIPTDRRNYTWVREYLLWRLAATTKLQIPELLSLRLADIIWHARLLHITDSVSGERKYIPFTEDIRQALSLFLQERTAAGAPSNSDAYLFWKPDETAHISSSSLPEKMESSSPGLETEMPPTQPPKGKCEAVVPPTATIPWDDDTRHGAGIPDRSESPDKTGTSAPVTSPLEFSSADPVSKGPPGSGNDSVAFPDIDPTKPAEFVLSDHDKFDDPDHEEMDPLRGIGPEL